MAAHNEFYEEINRDRIKDSELISQGAFGTIYRARHQDWGIDVALKILSRSTCFTQKELLNEARAMDKARFLYVVRFYGIVVDKLQLDNPSIGLVMEYMENGSLCDLMNQVNFIPWALRFRILYHVALGMNFLHSLSPPLLHLDLKLGNILLDAVLDAKVADFGLSKFKRGTIRSSSKASVEEEEYGGTLEYLPPEAFADPYKPTPGTDVYSYGIVTWSLLSGEEPYSNLHPVVLRSLLKIHIPQSQRPSTEKLEKIVDVLKVQDVVRLMKRCWHNDKAQRPSFRDCRQEMETVSSCYQRHMMAAVHEVQNILVQKKSSPGSTPKRDSPAPQSSEKVDLQSSPNTDSEKVEYQPSPNTSLELEERLKTMRVEESSYRPNEATPPATVSKRRQPGKLSAPMPLQRSQSEYLEKEAEEASNEESHQPEVKFRDRPKPADGKPPRPHSHSYIYPPYPPYQHYPEYMCLPPHEVDSGPAFRDHSLLPHFDSRYRGIHISGHGLSGLQIGNNNTMHIERTQTPGKKQ